VSFRSPLTTPIRRLSCSIHEADMLQCLLSSASGMGACDPGLPHPKAHRFGEPALARFNGILSASVLVHRSVNARGIGWLRRCGSKRRAVSVVVGTHAGLLPESFASREDIEQKGRCSWPASPLGISDRLRAIRSTFQARPMSAVSRYSAASASRHHVHVDAAIVALLRKLRPCPR
jgi:hypothetical protein